MTAHILSQNPDPLFRTQMIRTMPNIESHPTEVAVLEYHKHLLAEFETLAGAALRLPRRPFPSQVLKLRFAAMPNDPESPAGNKGCRGWKERQASISCLPRVVALARSVSSRIP